MKKLLVFILTLMMVGLFMGCDENDSISTEDDSVQNNSFTDFTTIQGTIYDGTNGARLTGSSLKVYMTRGATTYTPSVLRNGTSETTFAGDYAFTNVPITIGAEVTYRIIVTMDGYQTFEGFISPTVTTPPAAATNNTVNTEFNTVGNVYLFPLGETAADLTIYVEYQGERVGNATVQLQQDVAANNPTAETNNTVPAAVNGALPDLIGTTDGNGMVTFPGSSLVLGGQYDVVVLPTTHESVQLALNETVNNIVIGTADVIQVVAMADAWPGAASDVGLFIVSASNRDTNDVVASGTLTVVFSRPVYLVSEDNCTAALTNNTTAALDVDTCTATLSADGLTLTLKPNLGTAVVPYNGLNGSAGSNTADRNLKVTYSNVVVGLKDDNTYTPQNIFTGLVDYSGAAINDTVNMTSPLDD